MKCKNCKEESLGNFCTNCGQRLEISPITMHAIIHELIAAINLERGLLHTFQDLSIRPGKMIREYIEGKRIVYMSPLRYLFFMVAIGALAGLFYKVSPIIEVGADEAQNANAYKEIERVIKEYYSLLSFVSVPFFALFSWMFFAKNNKSYAQHLVLNAYVSAHANLFFVISLPLLVQDSKMLYGIGNFFFLSAAVIYSIWAYMQFFSPKTKWLALLKSFIVYMLSSFIIQFIMGVIVGFTDKL